jgi:cysteine sulfinate desulfinase/cysteine desulfurase-like protein
VPPVILSEAKNLGSCSSHDPRRSFVACGDVAKLLLESGSACLADSDEPLRVIKAMKPDSTASRQMIRFSLDASTTLDEIRLAVTAVGGATDALRGVGARPLG